MAPLLAQFPELKKLSDIEKIQLSEELRDFVLHEDAPIPESHKRELDRRLARIRSGEAELITWEEMEKRVFGM